MWVFIRSFIMAENYIETLAIIMTIANSASLIWQAVRKNKPEIRKLESEADSEIADAAHTIQEGAVLSNQMLKDRVDDLQKDLATEKKSRRDDAEYFRRRIKDIEKEARDYRLWAARLAKQVIEAGKVPVPFISSLNDSDPLIAAITREQAELDKERTAREAEITSDSEKK
jgi:hypothetical protein